MGGGGGKGGGGSNPAAETQARLAEQMFLQTDPLRSALIERSAAFLGAPSAPTDLEAARMASAPVPQGRGPMGNMVSELLQRRRDAAIANPASQPTPRVGGSPMGFGDVMGTPTYAAFRDSTNRTFGAARDNTMSRLPAGGALLESLAGLEGQKASTLTQGAGQIYESELARAMGLATGMVPQAMGGLGQAALAQAQAAAMEAQQGAAKAGGLGSAAGTALGFMMGGPAGAAAGGMIGGSAGQAAAAGVS